MWHLKSKFLIYQKQHIEVLLAFSDFSKTPKYRFSNIFVFLVGLEQLFRNIEYPTSSPKLTKTENFSENRLCHTNASNYSQTCNSWNIPLIRANFRSSCKFLEFLKIKKIDMLLVIFTQAIRLLKQSKIV